MKKIAEFIFNDQPGHIILTGGGIKKYFDPKAKMTTQEKKEYFKGLISMYPYMFLGNYNNWLFDGKSPKNYEEFLKADQPATAAKVTPAIEAWYDEKSSLSYEERVKGKIGLFLDIPLLVLGSYHAWLYKGEKGAKDFKEFVQQTRPLTSVLGNVVLKAYYDTKNPLSVPEKTQVMLFLGTEYAQILIRKYYTWVFGEEKITMPGPPPAKK